MFLNWFKLNKPIYLYIKNRKLFFQLASVVVFGINTRQTYVNFIKHFKWSGIRIEWLFFISVQDRHSRLNTSRLETVFEGSCKRNNLIHDSRNLLTESNLLFGIITGIYISFDCYLGRVVIFQTTCHPQKWVPH